MDQRQARSLRYSIQLGAILAVCMGISPKADRQHVCGHVVSDASIAQPVNHQFDAVAFLPAAMFRFDVWQT